MKKLALLILLVIGYTAGSFSQIDKMRDQVEDAGAEAQGQFTLRFINAENGEPVTLATIKIQDFKTFTTDMEGKIRFEKIADGVYPFQRYSP